MQTVGSLFSTGGQSSNALDAQMDGPAGGGIGQLTPGQIGGARMGLSAVSAISNYALSQSQGDALQLEAENEQLAARGDYIQAQQRSNAVNLQAKQVMGKQLAYAAAGGIDVGSGSVIEAQRQTEQAQDRANLAIRTSAQTDASLRMARASFLNYSASADKQSGLLSMFGDLTRAGLQFGQIGGS